MPLALPLYPLPSFPLSSAALYSLFEKNRSIVKSSHLVKINLIIRKTKTPTM